MKEAADADVLDVGMIADAQAVEHYEIARYARSSPGPISLE
jgi:ferritin-like metal-binding protein YciE